MKTRFTAFAVTAAVVLTMIAPTVALGSSWGTTLGSRRGVTAYSNGSAGFVGPTGTYGIQYQCVEFVNRYYVQALGWKNMRGYGDADDYFTSTATGLDRFANGGTMAPQADDLLCFSGGANGHVAIVVSVGASSIMIIEQNWSNGAVGTCFRNLSITASGGRYTVGSGATAYSVQGWLRKPRSTVIVNDGGAGYTQYGPSAWWHYSMIGYGGMRWTYNSLAVRYNYARWTPSLAGGRYEVYAYIPSNYATTRSAQYEISCRNMCAYRTVNQLAYSDVWVSIGTYDFAPGTGGFVQLTDVTGERDNTRMVGFDAVKFVPR